MQIVQNISLLPLTIWMHPCKIDSVWCTLAQCFEGKRFMITGVMPGFAFYALFRRFALIFSGYSPVICHAQMNIGIGTHPFCAHFYKKEVCC